MLSCFFNNKTRRRLKYLSRETDTKYTHTSVSDGHSASVANSGNITAANTLTSTTNTAVNAAAIAAMNVAEALIGVKRNRIFNSKIFNNSHKALPVESEEVLYVIVPYFNFCKSQRRYDLFLEFIERLSKYDKVKIVISEATNTDTFDLPDDMEFVYQHHGFKLESEYWCKENLINVAVRSLPLTWKYIAWIDADLTFLNDNWVEETLNELKIAHFVQLFASAVYLGPNEEAMRVDRGFGYMYKNSKHDWRSDHKYGFWHCGFAWACNKYAYEKTNGLIDYAILGSGDHHMALSYIQKVEMSFPKNNKIHESFFQKLKDYQALVRIHKLRLSYIEGTILHHWHGSLEDRKYVERWDIFYKHNYNPEEDIVYNHEGLINLSEKGKRMEIDIVQYFIDRREDNTVVNV